MKLKDVVNELLALWAEGHGNDEVLMSSDAEGNSLSPYRGHFVAEGAPIKGCQWYWEISDEPDATTPGDTFTVPNAVPCVVLKPTN